MLTIAKIRNVNIKPFWYNRLLYFIGFCLIAHHFYILMKYAIDVPWHDSWAFLEQGALDRSLNVNWLFRTHNEHIVLTTKIYYWLFLLIDSLNFKHMVFVNFFFYISIPIVIALFLERRLKIPCGIIFIPYASMITIENISWAFQIQHHFCILFFILGCITIDTQKRSQIMSPIFIVLSVFSFSYGIPFLIPYILLCGFLYFTERNKKYIFFILIVLLAFVLWVQLAKNSITSNHVNSYPWDFRVWFSFF
ncbi:MAG: hypothetical protein AAF518_20125, partial [Spirochaetota bacterium]